MSAPNGRGASNAPQRLEIRQVFDSLTKNEALYAHYLARACWHGTRVMLRQTSAEAEGIFDFILELHRACNGQWANYRDIGASEEDLDAWLEYAGMVLSGVGNYYGDGDRKVVPAVSKDVLKNMASISPTANERLHRILTPMMSPQPATLDYPSDTGQSGYYPGNLRITKEEVEAITKKMQTEEIAPENTRLEKLRDDTYHILQASAEKDDVPRFLWDISIEDRQAKVYLCRGDHAEEMVKICESLANARKYATTNEQQITLSQLGESFLTGNYEATRSAQETWVNDKTPKIEHCMAFLFGYRDPCGVRAEWQAASGIADSDETNKMTRLVERYDKAVCLLPWAVPGENDGKGPFEPSEAFIPDFQIIHVLGSVSSTIWEATNITCDNDAGERLGVKNIVYGNRMSLNSSPGRPCYYVHPSEAKAYMKHANICRFIQTVIHELIGHGTGKLLAETAPGKYNFDHEKPPVSPVTGKPVQTWYGPGQSWSSVFGKLAPTVEECRAFLVANYLADNQDILATFGYDESSSPTADDLIYYTYLQIGVEGLLALRSYNVEDQTWGGDHDQARFAILKHILRDGNGALRVEHEFDAKTLYVRIDHDKMVSEGKASVGRMLTKIHVWHSTADIKTCRPFYEELSSVSGEHETWRQIVASNPEPKWKFVQPNTLLRKDGTVELREYEASNVGIIQSFIERNL